MTRRKKREAVFGMLLAGLMAACLLLTVSTGIDFAKAEEVYRGVFQGYSAALTDEDGTSAEKQLYDATNTYEYIEYAGHDYTADYVMEDGAKTFKDWYDMSPKNWDDMSTEEEKPIASGAPGIQSTPWARCSPLPSTA